MISLKTKLTVIVPGKLTEAAFGPGNEDKPGKITEEVEWLINTEYIRYNELLPCVKNICKMWLALLFNLSLVGVAQKMRHAA